MKWKAEKPAWALDLAVLLAQCLPVNTGISPEPLRAAGILGPEGILWESGRFGGALLGCCGVSTHHLGSIIYQNLTGRHHGCTHSTFSHHRLIQHAHRVCCSSGRAGARASWSHRWTCECALLPAGWKVFLFETAPAWTRRGLTAAVRADHSSGLRCEGENHTWNFSHPPRLAHKGQTLGPTASTDDGGHIYRGKSRKGN